MAMTAVPGGEAKRQQQPRPQRHHNEFDDLVPAAHPPHRPFRCCTSIYKRAAGGSLPGQNGQQTPLFDRCFAAFSGDLVADAQGKIGGQQVLVQGVFDPLQGDPAASPP